MAKAEVAIEAVIKESDAVTKLQKQLYCIHCTSGGALHD